eukprot:TRINITY_DN2661_c0_g1_i7.p1 TRINITY_DN2661_c0_g1~~TRINITY_DN2661_c0_g1_i7.p1  ORF type:complete len:227 (+),score=18.44 TRINITY_DN2661_c0_g1_i7:504-1184(+)
MLEPIEMIAPVHRLGRGTSGILLISCTKASSRVLSKAFVERQIEKHYLAILSGIPTWDQKNVNIGIGKVSSAVSLNMKLSNYHWVAQERGKPSHSFFTILKRYPHKGVTLCSVQIQTGRPHQIRIHSAYCGYPLYLDPLYVVGGGVDPKVENGVFEDLTDDERPSGVLPGDTGYFLHSWKLGFQHPSSGELVKFCCEPPQQFLQNLEKGDDTLLLRMMQEWKIKMC